MSVCEDTEDKQDEDLCDDSDDEDEDIKKKKSNKPPISLELQRLFYQLQTRAESNHQNEYQINIKHDTPSPAIHQETDDGNISDCSVFTLQSDTEISTEDEDHDVDMSADLKINDDIPSSMDLDINWHSSYDKAVSTQQLIKSFGWSGSDSFVQHDVQEFLRVLMDKIEAKVKGTPAEKIVEKLFSGEYQSYISCVNADFESVRSEKFQDIQLKTPKDRGFYGGIPDIYDCIRKFI